MSVPCGDASSSSSSSADDARTNAGADADAFNAAADDGAGAVIVTGNGKPAARGRFTPLLLDDDVGMTDADADVIKRPFCDVSLISSLILPDPDILVVVPADGGRSP